MTTADGILLELEGLTKTFPGVVANDGVSFRVRRGEIHALLGENGAGKSTLVKMIYGVLRPDGGTMRFNGEPYSPHKPSDARAHGIGMVFQHFSLFEALTVKENIELGISPELARAHTRSRASALALRFASIFPNSGRNLRLDRCTEGDLRRRIIEVSSAYGLKLAPDRRVGELSVGVRQRVEIVRCLLQNPRLIIMDEPTSVLTPQEVELLFATLRRLAAEGCSILYISHKLEEIRALCHHATILRGGRVVATCTPAGETAKSLAEMMIGAILMPARREGGGTGAVRLKLDRLTLPSEAAFGVDLTDISLDVRAGEIVGIAGVAGNGQDELMTALIGETRLPRADAIQLDGRPIGGAGPDARRALGMCFAPEERLGHAAVPNMNLTENAVLSARIRKGLARLGFINYPVSEQFSGQVVGDFNVKTAGLSHAARSLSGGNLQKFIMGREILQAPAVLVAAQPTWGVDAGAAAAIHQALLKLAREGATILVISQDLDELMAICDRIAVIADGRLTRAEPVETLTVEAIGSNMGGTGGEQVAHA